MKIIFVNRFFYPDFSATSQILSDLAFFLAKEGWDVRVVTSALQYDRPDVRLPTFDEVQGVKVYRVRTTSFGRSYRVRRAIDYVSFYITAGWRMWRLAGRGDLIVAKTDPPLLSVVAMITSRLRAAQLVNWLQDIFPEVAGAVQMRIRGIPVGQGILSNLIASVRDLSLRAARMNIVLSAPMADVVAKRGIPSERIAVIPNWADDKAIVPVAAAANPLLAAWDLADKFVVGYSGNLGVVHEFGTILGAVRVLRDNPRIVFLIIGGGARIGELKIAAAEEGLKNLVFQPYQPRDQLSFSLGAAALHLISLRPALEGLIVPSKLYGIAAAGRATAFVGAKDGEVAQFLDLHDCGRTFAIGDAAGLAGYLASLAYNDAEVARLGANARRAVDSQYSLSRSCDRWNKLLTQVVTRPVAEARVDSQDKAAVREI